MSPTIQKPNIKYPERHSQVPTVHGAITTLITSIVLFILIQACFEFNRYYKQIYLKRLQKRFEVTDEKCGNWTENKYLWRTLLWSHPGYWTCATSSSKSCFWLAHSHNECTGNHRLMSLDFATSRFYVAGIRNWRPSNGWIGCLHATSIPDCLLQVSD